MKYFKNLLCGFAAICIAEAVLMFVSLFRSLPSDKAIGLAAVTGYAVENFLSPLFWILAIAVFGLLFAASRLEMRALRVCFFWIPSVMASSLTVVAMALVAYVFLRFSHA